MNEGTTMSLGTPNSGSTFHLRRRLVLRTALASAFFGMPTIAGVPIARDVVVIEAGIARLFEDL